MHAPPLGLYVHLPWCERKCPYCDFNSHESDNLPEVDYVDALLRDLEDDAPLVSDRPVETLFIGGGTPSLFSPAAIGRLIAGIDERVTLSPSLEATMEANPGSAEADKFAGFAAAGINRLSLGIQSFDDNCLHALGRVHDSAAAHRAVEYAKAAGFDSINLDLMHGLPGQDPAGAARDLRAAIAHDTKHLSWYQLTIEPNTVFYNRPPRLPDEDRLADIQDAGEMLLAGSGFAQYEVSAYARPGFECRHNLNYWRFGDYLGIGAGAHAKLTDAHGVVTRSAKRRQPQDYMASAPGAFVAQSRALAPGDLVGEFMLNALRLNAGFDSATFTGSTGLPLSALEPALSRACDEGLLEKDGASTRATTTGRRFLNDVVARFLPRD